MSRYTWWKALPFDSIEVNFSGNAEAIHLHVQRQAAGLKGRATYLSDVVDGAPLPSVAVVGTRQACERPNGRLTNDPYGADAAVYRALLDSITNTEAAHRPAQLVVIDSTLTAHAEDTDLQKLPEADSAAISEFQKRNSESHSLAYLSSRNIRIPIVLVSRQTLESFLHNGPEAYWTEFYRRYPGSTGSITFSSIGYNAEGDAAILVLEQGCGTLCGAVSNVVVKRVLDRWRVTLIEIKIVS